MAEKVEVNIKGNYVMVDAVRENGKTVIISGRLFKTGRIKDDLYEDVEDPPSLIAALKKADTKIDFFTFWQRVPNLDPKYDYYMEWDDQAILPVSTYEGWYSKTLNKKARYMVRKAKEAGVVIKVVDFDDELVKGIKNIFDETPIRQGKPFWHYGKDFDIVRKDMSRDLEISEFIGAYYNDELIGFIKMLYADRFGDPVQCLSMIKHYDKAPNNALFAKAVEICAEKRVPFIHYGPWRRGSHGDFLRHNGFQKVRVPIYYVPLTIKGKIILKLNLHKGIVGALPEKLVVRFIKVRNSWYVRKYAGKRPQVTDKEHHNE